MESTIDNSNNSRVPFNERMELIKDVLRSGSSVELPATGHSMFPVLLPGDSIVVNQLHDGEMPVPGMILIFEENGMLVIHRLIEVHPEVPGKILFVTRGDSRSDADLPWLQEKLIGVAVKFRRRNREYSLKSYIPSAIRYCYNLKTLWMYHKISSLKNMGAIKPGNGR